MHVKQLAKPAAKMSHDLSDGIRIKGLTVSRRRCMQPISFHDFDFAPSENVCPEKMVYASVGRALVWPKSYEGRSSRAGSVARSLVVAARQ
jgi:hypothetical protein